MIKPLLYAFLIACCSSSAFATDLSSQKINPAGRILIYKFRHGMNLDLTPMPGGDFELASSSNSQSEPFVSALVILEEGYDSSVLSGLDVRVDSEMDGVLTVTCLLTELEKIAAIKEVQSIETNVKLNAQLDFARPASTVTTVQNGFDHNGSTVSFDGSGVIVGMMDTGLEANHINFKNSDGSSRIKRLWHMNSYDGSSVEYTDKTISGFSTDNSSEGHATHVAGILGGSYKGQGRFYKLSSASGTSASLQTNADIPYYGVATGADLAFAVGELYTNNIIQGVTNIIDYAKQQGKPVVVNLSLGHTSGPHDGSDGYCQALKRLGKNGIICMSAGNDGDELISITKTLAASGNNAYLRTFPVSTALSGNNLENQRYKLGYANGVVDLWTDGPDAVTVSWKVYKDDFSTAETIFTLSSAGTATTSGNSVFSKYFTGSIESEAYLDRANNRYNVYSTVKVQRLSTVTSGILMLEVTGASGTKLYLYGNNVCFTNNNGSGTPIGVTKGSAAQSINDGCCGENVLSVGAYTTRTTWAQLNGAVYQYSSSSYVVNKIAPFSSYGTTYQGQNLPLVSAPGANIVSSYSRYYAGSSASTNMCASATDGANTYYWGPMQGTSMSCPYVTGTIGLWLQAWPEMTFDDVLNVINKTSTYKEQPQLSTGTGNYNGTAADKKKWGAGVLQALDGIKEVLVQKAAGIGEVWADDNQRLVITPVDGGYEVFVADATQLTATVYDLQGRAVATASSLDGTATVSTDRLAPGVYIIEARTPQLKLSRKVTR